MTDMGNTICPGHLVAGTYKDKQLHRKVKRLINLAGALSKLG
jgi:hypothetical protein